MDVDINQIAIQIADKVSSEVDITIAFVGAGGVIVGSLITVFGQWLLYKTKQKSKDVLDKKRQDHLKKMLNKDKNKWRKLSTLSSVIGADDRETKRLLIQIGARGSEKDKDVWALISNKPFPDA